MNLIEWAGGQPLAIDPGHLDAWASTLDAESLSGKPGAKHEASKVLSVRDGVAEINVRGVMSRYDSFWTWLFGGVSTESVARAVHEASSDPAIRSILLHVDSPGGQATGIGELAGYVRKAASVKPVAAYVEGSGCSAAYWVASAASEVVLSPSATVGSIGTLIQLDTRSRPGELVMVSTQSPMKRPDLNSEEGKASVQAWLDSLSAVFIADVAKYRGVSEKVVMSDFGKGDVLVGADAVKAGMADGLGDFESVFASMRDTGKALSVKGVSRRQSAERGISSDSRQGKASMNPFNVLSKLWASNPEAVQEAMATEGAALPALPLLGMSIPSVQGKYVGKSEQDIRAEVEAEYKAKFDRDIEAKAKVDRVANAKATADAWTKGLGDKLTPADAPRAAALYADALVADAELGPLKVVNADGSVAVYPRADGIKASYEARQPHGMTTQVVPADKAGDAAKQLAKAGRVLPNGDDQDAPKRADIDALLAMTDLGRKAIKIHKADA